VTEQLYTMEETSEQIKEVYNETAKEVLGYGKKQIYQQRCYLYERRGKETGGQ